MKKRRNYKPLLWLIVALPIIIFGLYGARKLYREYIVFTEKVNVQTDPAFKNPVQEPTKEPGVTIPSAKVLDMAYTVQAPLANWNIHEESCEEAAVLMYHYFLNGQTTFNNKTVIPAQTANTEEIKMKEWQVQHYGREPDLTISALGKFANEYYGYSYQTYENVTKDDIKKQIALGHPVVVPVMTQSLHNPHYSPGNVYHVVLIKGYKEDGVVTNDAGVKEGENYFYTWDTIFGAIDAQTAKMQQGRVMLTLTK